MHKEAFADRIFALHPTLNSLSTRTVSDGHAQVAIVVTEGIAYLYAATTKLHDSRLIAESASRDKRGGASFRIGALTMEEVRRGEKEPHFALNAAGAQELPGSIVGYVYTIPINELTA